MAIEIPDKTYFKIGEAAKLVGVKPYIIRYWESEFRAVRPAKTKSRQRLFRRKDIELLLLIKQLLYDQKFTIEGARLQLKDLTRSGLQYGEILEGIESKGLGSLVAQINAETDSEGSEEDEVSPEEHPESRATALALRDIETEVSALKEALAAARKAEEEATTRANATREKLLALQSQMRTMWQDIYNLSQTP